MASPFDTLITEIARARRDSMVRPVVRTGVVQPGGLVLLAGDTTPLPIVPASTVPLTVGDVVRTETVNRRITITGKQV